MILSPHFDLFYPLDKSCFWTASSFKLNGAFSICVCVDIYRHVYAVIHHYHHHLSHNHEGRWGTTDGITTSFLHFSLFPTAIWDFANSRPVRSLFFFSLCRLSPFTVPCKMFSVRPDERETWPYHCNLGQFTMVRRSSCSPMAMACILLWSSAMRVHDSQAYRKMDVARERINRVLHLSFQNSFNLVTAAVVCLEPSSVITEPRYWKLVTVSSFCPFTSISVLMPLVMFVTSLVFSALISMPWAVEAFSRRSTNFQVLLPLLLSHRCHQQLCFCLKISINK